MKKIGRRTFVISLLLAGFGAFPLRRAWPALPAETVPSVGTVLPVSDHFNGSHFFNPGVLQSPAPGQEPKRGGSGWFWRWVFGPEWPEWPQVPALSPGPPPDVRVPKGTLRITPVGHATFLIQMDRLNLLTDPIWSERCSPVSWAGPKRYRAPGIRFEDLPPIDAVLITHNHYDHLDIPTLERLARKGTSRAIVPLGNLDLVRSAGIAEVETLDWWQSVRLSRHVAVTLVPALHFSSRTLWDRNRSLWGGFVVSGPSGNLYQAGDTAYGPHFREIARRFQPIRAAILPISPFRPLPSDDAAGVRRPSVHMGPAEAVEAHLDLEARLSVACHFQAFQLGPDGFDDAVTELASMLRTRDLNPEAFITPLPGQILSVAPTPGIAVGDGPEDGRRRRLLGRWTPVRESAAR
ncbi:MAG: MBL fold metallo-hydrolase [Deltaproteobacteria bacterium]|nr:MBL fold metallo-hydrolase [Deltaproteobacteria bacterium]